MNIVYILYNKLHIYPPCVSYIRMIKKLGYSIEVIYGNCDDKVIEILKNEEIKCKKVAFENSDNLSSFAKISRILMFRNKMKKELKKYSSDTVFWIGNAETAIVLKGLFKNKKYILSLLELYDDKDKFRGKLLHGLVENATMVTVCEETRAHLTKHWYNLKQLPTVFPNKSYEQLRMVRANPSDERTMTIINEIKNENIIIYQGIIMKTDELFETAMALNELKMNYKLVLMGMDKENVFDDIKKIYNNTVLFNYVPAPLHLEVTSYARIGLLFYNSNNLNYAFCAPNKIYEYSGFGIPMIGNDIPGLKNTIASSRAGICVKPNKDNIKEAIMKVEENYDEFSNNSKKFFEECDMLTKMNDFLKEIENK